MKCRNVKAVLRYHKANERKEQELYYYHFLMLYYPWRDEYSLMVSDHNYASTFSETDVQAVVEHNRAIFEPDSDSYDSINDQENADL